jgi:hypothetical protein
MGTPLYMELAEACSLVQEYAEENTNNDILAALAEMQADYDDLEKEYRVAYRMFVAAGQKLLSA